MIMLHQYPPAFGLSSLSPFCIKVESYLRMMRLPYTSVTEINPSRGPRGRMPFIRCGCDVVPDSHSILDYLEARTGNPLDAHLTPEQKGTALALRRMMDLDLYRVILYSRWVDPRGWNVLKKEFLRYFPYGMRRLALYSIRRSLIKEARDCGILEHSESEIYALGEQHLDTLATILGEKPFLFGERPSTADITAYAFLAVIMETPIDVPLRTHLRPKENLMRLLKQTENLWRDSLSEGL